MWYHRIDSLILLICWSMSLHFKKFEKYIFNILNINDYIIIFYHILYFKTSNVVNNYFSRWILNVKDTITTISKFNKIINTFKYLLSIILVIKSIFKPTI